MHFCGNVHFNFVTLGDGSEWSSSFTRTLSLQRQFGLRFTFVRVLFFIDSMYLIVVIIVSEFGKYSLNVKSVSVVAPTSVAAQETFIAAQASFPRNVETDVQPQAKVAMVNHIVEYAEGGDKPTSISIGLIVGIALAALFVLAVIGVCIALVVRRYRSSTTSTSTTTNDNDNNAYSAPPAVLEEQARRTSNNSNNDSDSSLTYSAPLSQVFVRSIVVIDFVCEITKRNTRMCSCTQHRLLCWNRKRVNSDMSHRRSFSWPSRCAVLSIRSTMTMMIRQVIVVGVVSIGFCEFERFFG